MIEHLLRNLPLKLLALGLALAVWVAVTGENRIFGDFRVPLQVDLRDDRILSGLPPTTVSVRLKGSESAIRRVDPLRLALRVDLRDADMGERKIQLGPRDLRGVPRDVEVALVEPDRLSLRVDRRARRSLPVAPLFVGKPPAGYAFYGSVVVPDSLEVEGPAADVEAMDRLRTDPIHLEGREVSFVERVGAVPAPAGTRVVDPRPLEVRVAIDAAPTRATLEGVRVVLAGQPRAASVAPSAVRVVLSGPPALVARMRPYQLRAVADLTGLAPRSSPLLVPLRVDFPEIPAGELARISVRSVTPASAEVRLAPRRPPP